MAFIKAIGGIQYIEASTDNEIDPLFNTREFRYKWIDEVREYEQSLGLKVVSLYSGYATYRTVGLAHWAASSRNKLIRNYYKPVVDVAQALKAQVGNTLSAFSDPQLSDSSQFYRTEKILLSHLASMTEYAGIHNVQFSYEQMYTPNQGFWKIEDCLRYMRQVYFTCGIPMYITIDTAHQCGQRLFIKPGSDEIEQMVMQKSTGYSRLPEPIREMIIRGCSTSDLQSVIDSYPYLFCSPEDTDVYAWFSNLGCYSPIVHLQQTDGTFSAHKPFTPENNAKGCIEPKRILQAIAKSYEKNDDSGIPKVTDIYLTFELFFSITDDKTRIYDDLVKSVEYWRDVIPEDGRYLNDLI